MWPESGLGGEWGWGIVSPEATAVAWGSWSGRWGFRPRCPTCLLAGLPVSRQWRGLVPLTPAVLPAGCGSTAWGTDSLSSGPG